jgi:hypothetical protein
MSPLTVITWCCVAIFGCTVILTFLGLTGKLQFGSNKTEHKRYVRVLFYLLIVGVVSCCLFVFAGAVKDSISPFEIVVLSAALVFAAAALISILSLANVIQLGRTPEEDAYYRKRLFTALVLEVIVASTSAFALYLKDSPIIGDLNNKNQVLQDKLKSICGVASDSPSWTCTRSLQGTTLYFEAERSGTDPVAYYKIMKEAQVEYQEAVNNDVHNASLRVNVAALDNELGNFQQAETTLRQLLAEPNVASNPGIRDWIGGELACSLALQNKSEEYEKVFAQVTSAAENMRSWIPRQINKYRGSEQARAQLSDATRQELKNFNPVALK